MSITKRLLESDMICRSELDVLHALGEGADFAELLDRLTDGLFNAKVEETLGMTLDRLEDGGFVEQVEDNVWLPTDLAPGAVDCLRCGRAAAAAHGLCDDCLDGLMSR